MIYLQENISLKNHNTFHIDAKARFFVEIENENDFAELINMEIWNQYPHFFLGGGANIVFTKDFDGIIVKNKIMGKKILRVENDTVYLKVGAGESRPLLVNRCVENNYQGLENLALIPGTVGGSPVGNIGAYGSEVKDLVYEVEYIDLESGQRKILTNAECKFAYRDSIFKHELKNKVFITQVIFALRKVEDDVALKTAVANIIAQRHAKLPDPAQVGTAGSFFKNPIVSKDEYEKIKNRYPDLINYPAGNEKVKLAAGQLIELCGLKGYKMGNVAVSAAHALVLINLGNGTGEEIIVLANHIISEVKKNFGITLDPEVIYV